MIKIKNLNKTYKRPIAEKKGIVGSIRYFFFRRTEEIKAVENIILNISVGEIVGLIGSNGSGKTTLIKLMTGIIKPSTGSILIDGYDPYKKEKDFLNNIGVMLAQKNQLWWDLPPTDSFNLNKAIYNISDDDYNKRLDKLTHELNVSHVLETPVRNLSLGERMKCELIMTLLHEPSILFLDEPTIGLDYASQKKIRKFLKEYAKDKKTTIILTSHYIDDITEVCERVIILNDGTIAKDTNIDSLNDKLHKEELINVIVSTKIEIDASKLYTYKILTDAKQIDENSVEIIVNKNDKNELLNLINEEYEILEFKIGGKIVETLLKEFS